MTFFISTAINDWSHGNWEYNNGYKVREQIGKGWMGKSSPMDTQLLFKKQKQNKTWNCGNSMHIENN